MVCVSVPVVPEPRHVSGHGGSAGRSETQRPQRRLEDRRQTQAPQGTYALKPY